MRCRRCGSQASDGILCSKHREEYRMSGKVIGIVGSEAAKFTKETEAEAKRIIRKLLEPANVRAVSSGHCHLGGIDLYAEEVAKEMGKFDPSLIFPPKNLKWEGGYKQRNLQIARASDKVYCITVKEYHPDYQGMRFSYCYHCETKNHVKSGGCWTVKQAHKLGKAGDIIVI